MKNQDRAHQRNKAPRTPTQSRERRPAPVPKTEPLGFAPQIPNGSGIPHTTSNRPVADGRNFPTDSASSPALVKRPRDDGKPGQQWEGAVEVIESAEGLECVATDSNATLPTALYERPDGRLVFYSHDRLSGVDQWKDISLVEALAWVRNWMAPLEVRGRFGDRVSALCRNLAPQLEILRLEDSLNKAAALLDLFSDVISDGDDRGEQFNAGCVTLSSESAKELKNALETICNFKAKMVELVVSDSSLNPGWKQLGPILPLDAAA